MSDINTHSSRKQGIYGEILELILPYARNVQTWNAWRRLSTNLYTELELVHNLGPLIVHREFRDSDIHWINTQSRNYIAQCRQDPDTHPSYQRICELIRELISLVPAEFESKLHSIGVDF